MTLRFLALLALAASIDVARAPQLLESHLAAGRQGDVERLLDELVEAPGVPLETDRAVAAAFIRHGQPRLAARYLERVARRRPEAIVLADRASALFLAGDFARAAATLDTMARRGALAPPLRSLRGLAALRLGRRAEALDHFRRAAAADAKEGTASFYLGTLAAEDGDLAAAIRHLEVAARVYRDAYAARYNLALVLYRASRWRDGVRVLEQLAADPATATAEVSNLLGRGYDRLDRVKEAVDALQSAARKEPGNPAYVFDLGVLALRRRTYDLAEIVFASAIQTFPAERNLGLALGATLQLRGQMERAQAVFRDVAERHPRDPLALLYLGNSLFQAGRLEEAVEVFTRGAALDPKEPLMPYQAAVSLLKLGRSDDPRVAALLARALELDPKHAPAHFQLAKLAADRDDVPAARRALERALELDPSLAEAHFLRARICRLAGDAGCAASALARYEALRARELERLQNDRVLGLIYTLR